MMTKSKDDKVQHFLEGLQSADGKMYDIIMESRNIVFQNHPKTEEKMMYGGIIFYKGPEMFSGVFAYKNHVSQEFSNGYLMKDEHNMLEGTGKFRRHIKLNDKDDIKTKQLAYYIKQAI